MEKKTLFLLALTIPSILGQCNVQKATPFFKRSVFEFSVNLLQRISIEKEYHFVSSPFSLYTLLATLSYGAEDETLSELQKVLRLHPHSCFIDRYFDIARAATRSNDGTVLERSSTVFVDSRFAVKEDYLRKVTSTGGCNIMVQPFENFEEVAASINSYVKTSTHDLVDEIITVPSDIAGVYFMLIDAIYFKGVWNIPFTPEDTEPTAFYNENTRYLGDVNMMFVQDKFKIASVNHIQAEVLELPYGNADQFSMLIFLPNQNVPVATVLEKLKSVSLDSIFRMLEANAGDSVQVQMPRFKIASDIDNMKELLIDMGLESMFDQMTARFPYLSDFSLFVSNVIQKAGVEVTEEGTVAFAASGVTLQSRSGPEQFTINRPFVYMIVEKSANIPLFAGVYSKPSVY